MSTSSSRGRTRRNQGLCGCAGRGRAKRRRLAPTSASGENANLVLPRTSAVNRNSITLPPSSPGDRREPRPVNPVPRLHGPGNGYGPAEWLPRLASAARIPSMDDVQQLTVLNGQLSSACRAGSWNNLNQILSSRFRYVDGATGSRSGDGPLHRGPARPPQSAAVHRPGGRPPRRRHRRRLRPHLQRNRPPPPLPGRLRPRIR